MTDKSDNGVIRPSSLPAISPAHLGARAAHLRGEVHTSPPLFRNDAAEPVRRFTQALGRSEAHPRRSASGNRSPPRSRPSRTPPRPAMLPATRTVAVVHGCEFTLGLVTNPPAETASGHRMRPPRVLRHGA